MNMYVNDMYELKEAYKFKKTHDGYVCIKHDGSVSTEDLFRLFDGMNDGGHIAVRIDNRLHSIRRVGNMFIGYVADPDIYDVMQYAIDTALQNDQFELHYQPQVDIVADKVVGAEALIRWNHPKYGTIPPMYFIPIAEQTGQIIPLGRWILGQACREYTNWASCLGEGIRMSVNISVKQLDDADFVPYVKSVLKAYGVNPSKFTVEITETVGPSNLEGMADILMQIREAGVDIAIDDFGIGYSALHYLHKLPIDRIKMDRSFTNSLHTKEGYIIARFLVDLAKNLNYDIIAEGVETRQQVEILRNIGFREAQGYFYSPALPASEFIAYAKAQ